MRPIDTFFDHEQDYPDLDIPGAAERLSRAVQCKTVHRADPSLTDLAPFDQLHDLIRSGYPHVIAAGTMEVLGRRSLLITLPGSDPDLRPCLFMSHQDVVPVVAGTENDWTYPPFSGAIAQGYIWGRGTLDIKNQVFGCLEAAEYLLSHGQRFRRTVYLAFGDDEETLNLGAKTLAETLQSRGVELEFVLDEGSCTIESGEAYGAPETYIAPVELMEKGYADLELSVRSPGGHSSRPFGGTSLGRISQAITRIVEHPFPVHLTPVMAGAFRAIAPYVTEEPLKTLVQDVDQNADAIAQYCYKTQALFPFVTTTIAPTVITGSSAACNVMPQDMRAVVNFRIAEGETAAQVLSHVREVIADESVELRFLQANDPSATARSDGYGYTRLVDAMGRYFRDVVFLPSLTAGATDAHCYEIICDTCLRYSPFVAPPEDAARGVHGTDERISVRAYAQGIRALIHLMERTSVQP